VLEIIVLRLLFWWGPDKIKAWLARQGISIGQRTVLGKSQIPLKIKLLM